MARAAKKTSPAIEREAATQGMRFANEAVSIEAAPYASRVSVRASSKGAKAYEKTLGFSLPAEPSKTTSKAGRHALWLGPDEWLVIDEKTEQANLVPSRSNNEMSVTDISHRNVAFLLSGPGAENCLNAGCPRDLSLKAFPAKTASRTILGKAEVVLYRTSKDTFRLECWRSFAPYVWAYLLEGAKDAHV